MSQMSQLSQSEGDRFDVVLIDGRRWFVCPVPHCGFRTPVDAGQWSRDALAVHVELHFMEVSCTRCAHLAG